MDKIFNYQQKGTIWNMVIKRRDPEIPTSQISQRSHQTRLGHHPIIDRSFQTPVNLGFVLNKFRIHLSETEYFLSNFPPISEDWKKGKTLNENVGLDIRDFPRKSRTSQ